MAEIRFKPNCPQDGKECVGKLKCKKDRVQGCAIELLEQWLLEQEEYQ